ncbi:LysM peptidoglycan-binding domain-containing protein [Bifidobacterium colobi]
MSGRKVYRRRRHAIMAMLVALMVAWFSVSAWTAQIARSDVGASNVTSYTVKPGDTLWSYAARITPQGHDVSETVDELIALNDLDSGSLRAGQRIVVPNE